MDPKEFKIIETLDSGSFNQVFLVENINTHKKYAAKTLFHKLSSEEERKAFTFEVQKLQLFLYPSIIQIVGSSYNNFFDEDYPTIFSDHISNRSLCHFLRNDSNSYELSNTGKYINLLGIALGLQYLHSQNLVHYNLRPENILLDDNFYPHISGYGLSKYRKDDFSKNFLKYELSQLFYIAPEILEKRNFNPKADVYSFSLIAYAIITGKEAILDGSPYYLQIQNVIDGKRPSLNSIENRELKKFLSKSWSKNLEDRPTFDEIVEILTDENFFSIFDVDLSIIMNYLHLYENQRKNIQDFSQKIFKFKKKKSFDVVFVGDSKVGKTALFETFLNRSKCLDTFTTIGTTNSIEKIETDIGTVSLNLCDTAGDEKFASCLSYYLKTAHAIVLFIDVSQNDSIQKIERWIEIVNKFNVLKYLAVTKCDLEWKCTKEELQSIADKNNLFPFFTSCEDLESINGMFIKVANDLATKYNFS